MSADGAPLCYFPNGGQDITVDMKPCHAGRHSMCCQFNETSPDICRPDGLCQDFSDDRQVWRQSCTDPEWKSPECLRLCLEHDASTITFCHDQSVCCGVKNANCCAAGGGFWIQDGEVVKTMPTSSTPVSSKPPGSTSELNQAHGNGGGGGGGGLTNGEKIGLGIGVSVGVIGLVVIGLLAACLVRQRKLLQKAAEQNSVLTSLSVMPQKEFVPPQELPNIAIRSELGGSRVT